MPTTAGLGVRTIADVVQLITHCNKAQADAAERAICLSRGNIAALAQTTGIAIAGVGNGGAIIVGKVGNRIQEAAVGGILPSAVMKGGQLPLARKFCHAAIKQGVAGAMGNRNIGSSLGISPAIGSAQAGAVAAGIRDTAAIVGQRK
ncbi:MAG: hypothetical protein IT223_05045 [Crocinitomicaceae bacterium]|nr:hypothetical protein [Crocinitomicaceae bacterium]